MILVAGESLIDMLPSGEPGAEVLRPVVGGSPFNVALALGRLGVPVRYLCPLSTDTFGARMREALRESGVDVSLCPRTEALSTLGFVFLDPATRSASYAFYTDGTAGCALSVRDLPETWDAELKCLHIGSFSLAVEPFGSAVETLVGRLPTDRVLSLDPNVRPFLVRDRDRFLRRYLGLMGRVDLLKLSVEDMEWLHPRSTQSEVARGYLDSGARLVVITDGARGASAHTRSGTARIEAPPVQVVDTVGAGDTFQAAMLTWLSEHGRLLRPALDGLGDTELERMLGFATRAAAINCTRPGCQPPRRAEVPDA